MNNINSFYQETVRIQTVVCGLLFSIFSFVYLYVFQCDVLEALHFSLAHGKTQFSAFGTAFVITVILLLLNWGVNHLTGLKGRLKSLSYLPSFFVLMAMGDVGRDVYLRTNHILWLWLLPLLIVGFIGITWGIKRRMQWPAQSNISRPILITSNLAILLIGCLLTFVVGNTDSSFHHELQIEKFLREKNLTDALKVSNKSTETTQTLTALRAYALSHAGKIGDALFTYPQYYKSEGLFFPEDSLRTLRYTNDSIYEHLGARPYNGENKLTYLHDICYNDEGKHLALDYYLSALLLEKQLDTFSEAIAEFFEPEDTLSRHYQEALLVYRTAHPEFSFAPNDSALVKEFAAYRQRQTEFSSKQEETNRMRREYGATYWWYYDYQK